MSLLSPWEIVVRGESGRNEFLRGPFALFEAHSRAKFEKTSLSTDGLPCPLQNSFRLLPPLRFPPGTEDSGGDFCGTGHGPFRALIVSNLKWGGPCRDHYVFPAGRYQNLPQFFKKPIDGISYFPYMVALSGRDKVCPRT